MEILDKAKIIRLRNLNGKYLIADEDEKSVRQDRNGTTINAHWMVELEEGQNFVRLKSCYGRYLTASDTPMFFPRATAKKIVQTPPNKRDSAAEWEVESNGSHILLKTRYGHFLRPYGWLPPFRNSVSHDIPYRTRTGLQKMQWEVDVVESTTGINLRRAQSDSLFNNPTPLANFPFVSTH